MNWIIYAIAGAFGVGFYNFFMAATKNMFPSTNINNLIFMFAVQLVGGLIGLIGLIYFKITNSKEFDNFFTKHVKFPYHYIFIPTIIQIIYLVVNLFALNKGGPIAMGIINMNTMVTIALGVMFLGNNINMKIVIGLLISILTATYSVMESNKLKKN